MQKKQSPSLRSKLGIGSPRGVIPVSFTWIMFLLLGFPQALEIMENMENH